MTTTTADDIAKAMRKLGLFPRQRAKRMAYAERWVDNGYGDVQDLYLLCREAARESTESVETQLVGWIGGAPRLMHEKIELARENRRPQTVLQEDQERSDSAEAEWLDLDMPAFRAWRWRRTLAEWVAGGWTVEAVAEEHGSTVDEVEAAVAEFAEATP